MHFLSLSSLLVEHQIEQIGAYNSSTSDLRYRSDLPSGFDDEGPLLNYRGTSRPGSRGSGGASPYHGDPGMTQSSYASYSDYRPTALAPRPASVDPEMYSSDYGTYSELPSLGRSSRYDTYRSGQGQPMPGGPPSVPRYSTPIHYESIARTPVRSAQPLDDGYLSDGGAKVSWMRQPRAAD